ncbi:MAG: hypothetical protein AB1724_02925 [Thermodesulfobacteriota bacterium]
MAKRIVILICYMLLASGFIGKNYCYAEETLSTNAEELYNLDLQDVDLAVLATTMSEWTRKKFELDNGVKGNLTLKTQKSVTKDELYNIFIEELKKEGFGIIEKGQKVVIVQDKKE